MKISINWIKDYVDLSGIEVDELVKRFNLSTAEIEGVEVKGADVQNVVFGKVLKVENHPESNHLHILKVEHNVLCKTLCKIKCFYKNFFL